MNERQEKQFSIAKEHAKAKNGQCLSYEYKNNITKMLWQCSNPKHKEWNATFHSVLIRDCWCPECGKEIGKHKQKNSQGLELAKAYAKSKNGECLSTEYKNCKSKLEWKCSNQNHKVWTARYTSIVNDDVWCPECGEMQAAANRTNKNALEMAECLAKSKNGDCLSTKYVSSNHKLLWKCSNKNHKEWYAKYSSVVNDGSWCPACSNEKYISESRVRLIFEIFYRQPFPSVKPKWNVNFLTGRCLELDGYCEIVKVAFEHDGEHHKKLVSYNKYEPVINTLMYQKCKDYEKKQNCKRQGVLLINVPILEQKDRNVFQLFLDNVINSCKKCGLVMTFTDDQLATLKKQFFAV